MENGSKKIQLIEDDHELAQIIAEEFAEQGYEIVISYTGGEGFVSILKNLPDLILCDFNMPGMSGS